MPMRKKTKIIATVGPAVGDQASLVRLIDRGVDLFRINTSHTSLEELRNWIRKIRQAEKKAGRVIGILMDLQGPRIRTGSLKGGLPLALKRGDKVRIASGLKIGGPGLVATPCPDFEKMVKAGDSILIDNGMIELNVSLIRGKEIQCTVISGGLLGENKGINLPYAGSHLPSINAKDKQCVKIAAELDLDYIALSFVRTKEDVQDVNKLVRRYKKEIPVIAKIEKPLAVKNIDSILDVCGGIMIARGDLGIEMGVEKVPALQKLLIELASRRALPIITATQMLESMMVHERPSRAEVSDIANAVFDGSDAVMLSGETSVGRFPIKSVTVMAEIIREAESHEDLWGTRSSRPVTEKENIAVHATAHAAEKAAAEYEACALLVYTVSGKTAFVLSKLRPTAVILALTSSVYMARQCTLFKGVVPLFIRQFRSTDQMLKEGDRVILQKKLLRSGQRVVVVTGKQALPGARFMTKLHEIGARRIVS